MRLLLPKPINTQVLLAALVSAILWNLLTWYLGFPSSSSHALIGGFIGAVVMGAGWQAIQLAGLEKILIALFASPLIGFVVGFLVLQTDLAAVLECHPAHQLAVQARPGRHRAGPGAQPRHQ